MKDKFYLQLTSSLTFPCLLFCFLIKNNLKLRRRRKKTGLLITGNETSIMSKTSAVQTPGFSPPAPVEKTPALGKKLRLR